MTGNHRLAAETHRLAAQWAGEGQDKAPYLWENFIKGRYRDIFPKSKLKIGKVLEIRKFK